MQSSVDSANSSLHKFVSEKMQSGVDNANSSLHNFVLEKMQSNVNNAKSSFLKFALEKCSCLEDKWDERCIEDIFECWDLMLIVICKIHGCILVL